MKKNSSEKSQLSVPNMCNKSCCPLLNFFQTEMLSKLV